MPLQFQTEILPKHVQAATAGIFWRQFIQPLAFALLTVFWLGAHLVLAVLFPRTSLWLHLGLALLLWSTLGGMAWITKRHYENLAAENFKNFEGAPVQVSLDEEAYHYDARWGRGQVPWRQFQSLWRLKQVWVLLQHAKDGVSVLLPVESLDEEARAFILARLGQHQAELHR